MATHLPPPLTLDNGRPLHEQARIDGLALPHVFSFAQLIGGASQAYWHDRFDEAMRHARENALAMRRDAFLMSLLQERKLAVSSLPWYLEVPDPRDPVQAFVRAQLTQSLRGTRGFGRMLWQWLEAIWFGRSGVQFEWCWEEVAGRRALAVRQWSPLQGDKIGHHWDGVPYVLVNSSRAAGLAGAEVVNTTAARALRLSGHWRERFVIHYHEVDDADFFEGEAGDGRWGTGIRSRIYWLDYLKREYLDWVVTYLERVGLGTTLWKYPAGVPGAKEEAEEAAKANSRRVNITVPVWENKGAATGGIERIEAPTGGVEVLRNMIDALDHYIERYVVGQAGSSRGQSAGLGNEAAHEFMSNTKDGIRDHDAHMLAETITGSDREPGVLSLMQRYTFPETAPDRPGGFPVMFRFGLERSLNNQRVETILKLVALGMPVRKDDLYNAAGISRPEPHDDIILPPAPEPGPGGGGGEDGDGKGPPDDKGKPDRKGGDKKDEKGGRGKPEHHARRKPPARNLLAYAEDEEPEPYSPSLDEMTTDLMGGSTFDQGVLDNLNEIKATHGVPVNRDEYYDQVVTEHRRRFPERYAADEPDPDDLLSDEEFVPDPEEEPPLRELPSQQTVRERIADRRRGSILDPNALPGDAGESDLYKAIHGTQMPAIDGTEDALEEYYGRGDRRPQRRLQ